MEMGNCHTRTTNGKQALEARRTAAKRQQRVLQTPAFWTKPTSMATRSNMIIRTNRRTHRHA
eukprot:1400334-Lingulodinium_polyedra.AAC.1